MRFLKTGLYPPLRFCIDKIPCKKKVMTDKVFFKEIDHTADLRVEIYGSDMADLFRNAANTLYRLLNINPFPALPCQDESDGEILNILGQDKEDVLIKMMGELLFQVLEAKKQFLTSKVVFKVPSGEKEEITATLEGRWHPVAREAFKGMKEIKAVTYYDVKIERGSKGLTATVVMDT